MIGHGNQKYTLILNKLWTPDSQALQINSAQRRSRLVEFGRDKTRHIPPYPAISRHCKIILERTVCVIVGIQLQYCLNCVAASLNWVAVNQQVNHRTRVGGRLAAFVSGSMSNCWACLLPGALSERWSADARCFFGRLSNCGHTRHRLRCSN